MSAANNGGPAFPIPLTDEQEQRWNQTPGLGSANGMTMRDYFAAKVLPACYAEACRECASRGWPHDWETGVALDAYAMADAMLAARAKGGEA